MLVVVLVKCGGGGGHKNLVYNQNVILSKPKVVSASGTWSGLNTTQFYGQIVQLDRIKQRNSASIFSGFLLKFQPQQQPSRYCGRGQSTRFKCDPSFGCGNVCVMGGETEPNLSSLGRRPVLRCYIILGEAGKCCSAGENGKKLPGWGVGGGGRRLNDPFLIIHCSPNLTFTLSGRWKRKRLGCVWIWCGCCLGSEIRSCLWGIPGRGNNGSDPLLCVVALLNQTIQRSDWILILLVPP